MLVSPYGSLSPHYGTSGGPDQRRYPLLMWLEGPCLMAPALERPPQGRSEAIQQMAE
jgi:hypothetical protein